MPKAILYIFLLGSFILMFSCGPRSGVHEDPPQKDSLEITEELSAEAIYRLNCASCHKVYYGLTAPPFKQMNLDGMLAYYDGKKPDSPNWKMHVELNVKRHDWERIYNWCCGGDPPIQMVNSSQ